MHNERPREIDPRSSVDQARIPPDERFEYAFECRDAAGDVSSIEDAATAVLNVTQDGAPDLRIEITARLDDGQLSTLASRALSCIGESDHCEVASVVALFSYVRDCVRSNTASWGDLVPCLERQIAAGDARVRYDSSATPKPDGARRILIATCPNPGDGDFEPAVLYMGKHSRAQWRRADLPTPEEISEAWERAAQIN